MFRVCQGAYKSLRTTCDLGKLRNYGGEVCHASYRRRLKRRRFPGVRRGGHLDCITSHQGQLASDEITRPPPDLLEGPSISGQFGGRAAMEPGGSQVSGISEFEILEEA